MEFGWNGSHPLGKRGPSFLLLVFGGDQFDSRACQLGQRTRFVGARPEFALDQRAHRLASDRIDRK